MAFNKGLRFVDSNSGDRFSLTIDSSSLSFFESNSSTEAYGAMVLTIRPAQGTGGDKEALIVGDNLAVGIEYNTAGDQYRLLLQDAVNHASNAFSTGHNTVFSEFAAVDVETTFAFNWNKNGTASIVQTGEDVRTKFMTPWVAQNQALDILIPATTGVEDYTVLLDDGKGSIVEVGAASAGPADENTVATAIKNAIDATDAYSASVTGATITVTRVDGGSFQVSAGTPTNLGLAGTDDSADIKVGVEGATGAALVALSSAQGAKGGSIGMDADYDGFISQIVEFNKALSVAEMNGYVADPSSVPDPTVTGGTSSKAVVTVVPAAEEFVLKLDDGTGNVTAQFKSDGDAAAKNVYTELETAFNALPEADQAGFIVTAIKNNAGDAVHLDISREDGADFTITSVTGGSTPLSSGVLKVNGVTTTLDEPFASSTVGSSSIALVVGSDDLGKNYQIVLDDGAGNQTTVSQFGTTTDDKDDVAADLTTKINALAGYSAAHTAGTDTVIISRADGKAFKVKLGVDDEANDLKVDGVALTTTFVTATNNSVDGVVATLSNGVKQNFDFTNLTNAIELVGAGPTGYTGEATLALKGTKLDDGTLATLAASGTVKVSSQEFEGGAVAPPAADGVEASNAIFTQIRNVEGSAGSRTMAIDIFVDPQFAGDALKSLSYTVAVDANIPIQTFMQVDASGGYSLGSPNGQNISARWFSPTGLTDLTSPIATIQVKESTTENNPTLTFSNVEVNGSDLTDKTNYTETFIQTLDAALVDVSGLLVSGLDNTTAAEGHYVLGKVAPGATSAAKTPANGLYLDVSSWTHMDATPNDATYILEVKNASALDLFEFDLLLPGQTDMTSVVFTPDANLPGDFVVATNAVTGRTLEVRADGTTTIAAGKTLGTIAVTVPGEFGKVQHFELANVQTNESIANENGRDLYVGVTETNASGVWTLDDMAAGIFNREYQGGPAVDVADVTSLDAFYALQVSAGLVPSWYGASVTEGQVVASDFDGTGKVTAADALAILEYVVGTNVPDPAPTVYEFYYDDAATIDAKVNEVDKVKALTADHTVAAIDLDLASQNDRVVLIGDLSDPAT